jgi:ABC-type sugar transport system, periplasmic component
MKKIAIILTVLVAGIFVLPVSSGEGNEVSAPFGKAVKYGDLKKALGPIPTPAKELHFGFVAQGKEDGIAQAISASRKQGVKIKVDIRATHDETSQMTLMSMMVNRRYDGILASAISEGNLQQPIERAFFTDIPLIFVDNAVSPLSSTLVGPDHRESGALAAEWFSQKIGAGEVAIISGIPRAAAARDCTEGFKQWLAENNPNIIVVDTLNGEWDRMKALVWTDTILRKYPNLRGVYANSDNMALGCLEAVRHSNKLGDCFVLGTGGTSEARASIQAGELAGSVDTFGFYVSQIGIEMLIRKIVGQELPLMVATPQAVVDATNIDADVTKLIDWTEISFE